MAFVEPVTLTGRGIRLEPLERAHHDALEEAAADGELWRIRVSSVPEPGGMAGYIEQALASRAAGDRFPFAVIEEATGRVLGSTSFHDIAPAVRRVEIGYTWYARSVQRTHVNTACKRLLLGHAFDALGMRTVYLHTSHHNLRSQAAIERLGAHRDGVIRQHKRHKDGALRDTVCYSILDAEWPAMRERLDACLSL